jgi:glucose/arabinose dehydrogenase
MTRRFLAPFAVAALVVSASASTAAPSRPAQRAASGITAHAVKQGLAFPAAFTFAPSGKIFFGERLTGNIRILNPATGNTPLFFHIPHLASTGEQGLLGLVLHPRFPTKPYVYACATRTVSGGLRNQIVRITDSGGTGTGMKVIFSSSTVAGDYHDGGHIRFGPDGMLYAVVGEAHTPANAQNLNVSGGKVVRMTPSGAIPSSNPFPGTRIWSYGLRNSFGFTFDPRTGRLWETENGPECNDELNRIVKGGNFGWGPNENCGGTSPYDTNNSGPKPRVLPKRWYTPTIAPTGIAFCQRCGLGTRNNGKLFFGTYNTHNIRRVALTANRLGVAGQTTVYSHGTAILSMEVGPNRAIYFSDPTGIWRLVRA